MPTVAEMEADLALLQAARLDYLLNGFVREVSRGGRRLVKDRPKMEDINDAISALLAAIADATEEAGGVYTRRRFAIGLRFGC